MQFTENFELKFLKEILLVCAFVAGYIASFTDNEVLRFLTLLAILGFLMIRFTLKHYLRELDANKLKTDLKH